MSQMSFVREVDKVRQSLKPDPRYRRLPFPVREECHRSRSFLGKVLMTSHAELHGGDAGRGGLLGKT
ncbi:MAG TPA: hypothetical protein VHF07_02540, partial [Nitrospiraceae bacterium]|nr:hypothetical protein [Nitrospiraceae bacterium]